MAIQNFVIEDTATGRFVSIPRKSLKWAYPKGGGVFVVEHLDGETGALVSFETDATGYAVIPLALTRQTDFDAPASTFKISDANIVGAYFGKNEVSDTDIADFTNWAAATTGSNPFTVALLEASATFTGPASSGAGATRTITYDTVAAGIPDGVTFTWTVDLGTINLDGKVLGTDFDVEFLLNGVVIHTLTNGDISTGSVSITDVADTNVAIRVINIADAQDFSGVSIPFDPSAFTFESESRMASGSNSVVEYNFNGEAFQFGVTEFPLAIATLGNNWLNIQTPISVSYGGNFGLGTVFVFSQGTVKQIQESASSATNAYVLIDKPQSFFQVLVNCSPATASDVLVNL